MENYRNSSPSEYSAFQKLLLDLKEQIFLDEDAETSSKLCKRVAKFENYFNKLSSKCCSVFQVFTKLSVN